MTDAVGGRLSPELSSRRLALCDLPGLIGLYGRALATDGGQPFAAEEWLLRRWFVDGVEDSVGVFADDHLVGACARRDGVSADGQRRLLIVGQVDPEQRGRGIGGRLLDAALDGVGTGAAATMVRVENESLTERADALYRSRGLTCVFAEDVMTRPLAAGLPAAPASSVVFTEWDASIAERFFAVYDAAFRERPGFRGWPAARWIDWITDDEDFRADLTLLASIAGVDAGFIAGAAGGIIAQLGVVPAARRRSVASVMILEVLRRMLAEGQTRAVLNVNVNNPGAIATYLRLGFRRTGRRARYEPARLAAPWQPR